MFDERIYTGKRKEELLEEGEFRGMKFRIKTNGAFPWAYVGVPHDASNYELFNKNREILKSLIDVHCGIPIIEDRGETLWFVWDYGHLYDFCRHDSWDRPLSNRAYTIEEIKRDIEAVVDQLLSLTDGIGESLSCDVVFKRRSF